MTHDRAYEAELAAAIETELDAGRLPDLDLLGCRFAPRDERRKLSPPRRPRTKARTRPTVGPRDNHRHRLIVAPRQSNPGKPLARQSPRDNHAGAATPGLLILIVADFSSRSSRDSQPTQRRNPPISM
jgi:hypothetical protein